ncbi:hypothetical protein [Actinoalloteichus hymeniacidonis]|uniref:Uncharacterized protein n=1 Tax=Actinoalloteichus hymeniacidonis TaxID=340345 RepID=A0AAC9MY12_9PSEU|nr:hypothetical protein [Actinoalloteichus hymeniacidonis]AOS63913.1 hypothetical protein TL08_15520 [Actinoalloteichus hymeniacidonis]MBB5908031.1 hypothetical protein [Actinoalloteichus hymeniacidonis]
MRTKSSTGRTPLALSLLAVLLATGCTGGERTASEDRVGPEANETGTASEDHHEGHGDGHGVAALGESFESLDELAAWVQDETGECADPAPANRDELIDYVGPQLAEYYEPFVSEWVTCSIPPYDRLGLVLFGEGELVEFQRSWQQAQADGRLNDNPVWAFGNGFAITAGSVGNDELGLHYLWCKPVDIEDAHRIPADVDGCEFARTAHH